MYGYWGRILEVDLSTSTTRIIEINDQVYRYFIGGRGLATYLLAREFGRKWRSLDPLSPENPLLILTGPLTGYYPGIKMIISGKSPQTRGVIGSAISSEVAIELKAAGYDGLVIKGCSSEPVYLYVDNDKCEIRGARELWGLRGRELIEKMAEIARKEHGLDRPPAYIYIGPAGENLVKTAAVMSKLAHAAGYGGYGAVMGSKKLKAIVVKGYGPLPKVFDYEGFARKRSEAISNLATRMARFRQWGTTHGTWYHGYYTSSTPVKNWQEEWHDKKDFSPLGFEKEVWVKNPWADYGCPVGCMKISRTTKNGEVYITDGPDYEMAAYMGANLGIFHPSDATALSALADELGLCGIQTGNVLGLAIELYEKGVLTKDEVGYDLSWGDSNTIKRLLEDIAYRRGIGSILAEGVYSAALEISRRKGVDVLKYAVQVKGVGIGAHGIRSKKDYPQPIAYAASVQGGDHTSVAGLPVESTESEAWSALLDSFVNCLFLDLGDTYTLEYLNTVTGWGFTLADLYNTGKRILTLQRLLLLLGGPDVVWNPVLHDDNPPRFYEPLPTGPYRGMSASREEVGRLLRKYYSELGWDEKGIPTPETLEKMGLGEFKDLLELVG